MGKKLAEGVYLIEGQEDMFPDANVYVLGDQAGDDLTLVDAGIIGKAKYKIESVGRLGLDIGKIRRIIMTHTHLDHIGCVPEILERVPDAELWVHETEAELLGHGDDRTVFGMQAFRDMCAAQFGMHPGKFTIPVARKLRDRENLKLGGASWQVVHIPGHSPGCIALYNERERILISGDVIYADEAVGRFDLHGADPEAHKASLYKLGELAVDMLLPGHGAAMEKVPSGYIHETARQWEPYIK